MCGASLSSSGGEGRGKEAPCRRCRSLTCRVRLGLPPPIRAFCRSLPGYNAACLSLTPRFSGVWAMVSASEPLQRFPHHPRAALKSVRAIPNPRPEDRRPKETRRPKSELIATPAEQQPIESGHSRNSDFGLRPSDFGAAEHDLPSTGRTSNLLTCPNFSIA